MNKNPIKSMRIFRSRNRLNRTERNRYFLKAKTGRITSAICGSIFLIAFVLAAFALSPTAQAQLAPPPDGGYPNNNTAEGTGALSGGTAGPDNTAIGFEALFGNTTGDSNTATGSIALMSNTTGNRNVATGYAALNSNTTGERNTATGRAAMTNNTTGNNNTADGHDALFNNLTGLRNEAAGSFAMFSNTSGNHNTATGYFALFSNTTADSNTADGYDALLNNTTGAGNIALGNFAGSNLTTGDNNIDIGNTGVAGESETIRIGTQGTQTATYVAGIHGTNIANGLVVKVDSSGHLGTVVSSARFKEAIKPMDKASEAILALKPVTFRYKKEFDAEGTPQFGLVAEEVAKVNPDLVVRESKGDIYSVRYDAVNAMLLNEFLKEHSKVEAQNRQIEKQEATIAELKTAVAQQQKDFAARLQGQDSKIAKVSNQVQMSKLALRTVLNDR